MGIRVINSYVFNRTCEKEREVNDLSGGETTQKSIKTKTPIKYDFTESALYSRENQKLSEFLNTNIIATNLGNNLNARMGIRVINSYVFNRTCGYFYYF
jgi:hypothetical protein